MVVGKGNANEGFYQSMLKKIESRGMGSSDLGWLKSKFHFSFADYHNAENINFGVLRVLNDDLVQPQTGFDTHSHRDMEIISYVIDGELTHADSLGQQRTLTRGDIQYMSAGTGIHHSEHNFGQVTARFLQIWIFPDKKGYPPKYGDYRLPLESRKNKWCHIVSGIAGDAPVRINQDANIYVIQIDKDKEVNFSVKNGRQAYLVQMEGTSTIYGIDLSERDAMEITEENILLKSVQLSHCILIEMQKN